MEIQDEISEFVVSVLNLYFKNIWLLADFCAFRIIYSVNKCFQNFFLYDVDYIFQGNTICHVARHSLYHIVLST